MAAIEYKGKFFADNAGQKYISEVAKEFNIQLSNEVADIILRTQSGRDIENANFKPYSDGYAKWKSGKKKRTIGGLPAGVNLTLTGKMLGAIRHKVVRQGNNYIGIIGFNSTNETEKAEYNMQMGRRFLGFTKDFIKRLETAVQKIIPK